MRLKSVACCTARFLLVGRLGCQTTIRHVKRPGKECEDCVKIGSDWVHLRECLTCGHVACCDSSPMRHATAHFKHTQHPIVASVEKCEGAFSLLSGPVGRPLPNFSTRVPHAWPFA